MLYYRAHAPFYGRGACFSDTASYCDEKFAFASKSEGQSVVGQQRQLILARVMCGRVKEYGTEKAPELTLPPEGFDSVRGGPHKFNGAWCRTLPHDSCVRPGAGVPTIPCEVHQPV